MSKIFKTSFLAVWTAEIIFLPLCQMPWLIGILHHGWPAISIHELALNHHGLLMKVLYVTIVISNLPDFLSILIYAKMYSIGRRIVEPTDNSPQPPFEGIWVGENEPPAEDMISVPENASQQQDKMRVILKLLKWNAIFCLIDLTTGLIWDRVLCQGRLGTVVGYTFQTFICYWIPIVVLGSNFKFFGNTWTWCDSNFIPTCYLLKKFYKQLL